MTNIVHKAKKAPRPVTPLGILVEKLETTQKLMQRADIPVGIKNSFQSAYELAAGLDPYLDQCSTGESEALANLAQKTAAEDWSQRFSDGNTVVELEQEMLSGNLEGQTLKMFVYMTKAKTILDIGMFTGYSALAMAEALPDDGKIVACEVDSYVAQFAQECFQASPHGSKIEVKVAPALETMRQLADAGASFDIAFIDADKGGYIDYYNLLLETNLLKSDGFIYVDNTLMQGQPYLDEDQQTANGAAIARFNEYVAQDDRVEQVILPVRDGLSVIRRKQ